MQEEKITRRPAKRRVIFPAIRRTNVRQMLTNDDSPVTMDAWNREIAHGRRFGSLRKEVKSMPITITLHIFGLVVTIRIKEENRHSDK